MALSIDHRLAVSTFQSSSGVAKLIRARSFPPLNALSARRVTSLREATSSVTVFTFVTLTRRCLFLLHNSWRVSVTFRGSVALVTARHIWLRPYAAL